LVARFVDSNIFVYVITNDPAYAKKSVAILTRFEEGEEMGWTSTLALSKSSHTLEGERNTMRLISSTSTSRVVR